MHLRCQHRDHRDHQVLDDHPVHLHLGHRNLVLRLGVGYRSQHLPDVERHLGEEHRCVERHPVPDERRRHRLGVEHHRDAGHGPCPGLS